MRLNNNLICKFQVIKCGHSNYSFISYSSFKFIILKKKFCQIDFLGLLGNGVSSTVMGPRVLPRVQFPLTGFRATEPCTRSEDVP